MYRTASEEFESIAADFATFSSIEDDESVADSFVGRTGRIDDLINCAGVMADGTVEDVN